MLGVNSEQKESMQHYISDSIYGLTLAWITSENSTKQLECRHLLTRTSSLDPIFCCLASLLGCPLSLSVVPRQLPVRSFLQPTLFRVPLPLPDTARFQVQKPFVWFRAKTDKGIVLLGGSPISCYSIIEEVCYHIFLSSIFQGLFRQCLLLFCCYFFSVQRQVLPLYTVQV